MAGNRKCSKTGSKPKNNDLKQIKLENLGLTGVTKTIEYAYDIRFWIPVRFSG